MKSHCQKLWLSLQWLGGGDVVALVHGRVALWVQSWAGLDLALHLFGRHVQQLWVQVETGGWKDALYVCGLA